MTRTTRSAIIGMAAILVAGLSLRITTISLGPLLPDLRSSTGYGETLLSLLTSIPLAPTLVIAPFAPWLARRFGRNGIIIVALGTITVRSEERRVGKVCSTTWAQGLGLSYVL